MDDQKCFAWCVFWTRRRRRRRRRRIQNNCDCEKRSSVSHSFYELKNTQEITRNNNYGELPRKNASLLLRYDEREGVDVTSSSSSSSSSFLSPFCSSSWMARFLLFFLYSRLPHFVFSRRERLLSLSIVSPPVPEPTVRWPR